MPEDQQKQRSDDSGFAGKYPYNHVWEDWSGHQVQWDNTPKAERYFMRHSSGNYTEMSHDGKSMSFTVGDNKSYNKSGMTQTTDENSDSKGTGHGRGQGGGGSHIVVAGDAGITVGGTTALVGMGKVNVRAQTAYMGTDGNMSMNVGGDMSTKVAGATTHETKGDHTIKAANIYLN